jgi:hypothetical protein
MKLTALNGIIATALLLLTLTLSACNKTTPIPWNADTEFRFAGLMSDDSHLVERVFANHELAFHQTADSPITYQVSGISTVRQLAYVHADLRTLSRERRIPMPLESAALNFGGLAATGSALTSITVKVTPGAHALIADRTADAPWRLVNVDSRGKWEGHVNTKGIVAHNNGWVYIAAVRDDINRYYRVNILTSQQEHISFTTLRSAGLSEPTPTDLAASTSNPSSSNAEQDNTTEKKSSSFKWPWQK